jgi:hypothetical protein
VVGAAVEVGAAVLLGAIVVLGPGTVDPADVVGAAVVVTAVEPAAVVEVPADSSPELHATGSTSSSDERRGIRMRLFMGHRLTGS